MPEHFPLFMPRQGRPLFGAEELTRRLAAIAQVTDRSRVLDLAPGPSSLFLAEAVGCSVVAADSDAVALSALATAAKEKGLAKRLETRQVTFPDLPFEDGAFNAVLICGRVPMRFQEAARAVRRVLAPSSRLLITYPVKVGRVNDPEAIGPLEKRLGEPLVLPQGLLAMLAQAGYEPESVETLGELEPDDYYREIEAHLSGAEAESIAQEIAAHRRHAGKPRFSYALAVGRRREAGEKPPPSRGGA